MMSVIELTAPPNVKAPDVPLGATPLNHQCPALWAIYGNYRAIVVFAYGADHAAEIAREVFPKQQVYAGWLRDETGVPMI